MKIILERNENITKEQLLDLVQILNDEATNGSYLFDLTPTPHLQGEQRKKGLSLVVIPETDSELWEEHKEIRRLQGVELRTEEDVEEFLKMYRDLVRAKADIDKYSE